MSVAVAMWWWKDGRAAYVLARAWADSCFGLLAGPRRQHAHPAVLTLTTARNRPVTWAYWLNGIRTHCQGHVHTRGTLRHVHCGRGRRGQSGSHHENASRGGRECGMHRSSIKAVASRNWPVSWRVQKGGPEPMKRRARDFRAWLVKAIS